MVKTDAQATDERMMRRCFALAAKSAEQGEYPYRAVIARNGRIVAETTNQVAHERDVTRHAEVVAICEAQKALDSTDLADCTIYSNVEPCAFCCYAIRESRIAKVVYSMRSPIMGGASRWNRVAKKLKLQERRAVIPSRRSLAACRPLHFFEAINGALCGSADKWGETHGVGTYPGLHYGDGGPGAAAAE